MTTMTALHTVTQMANNGPEIAADDAEFTKLIRTIARADKTIRPALHKAAVSALHQCSMGNSTWMLRLLNALPGMAKSRDIAAWAKAHSAGKLLVRGKPGEYSVKYVTGWKADDFDVALANGTPFWLFKPETNKGDEALDIDGLLAWLQKRDGSSKVAVTPEVAQLCQQLSAIVFEAKMEAAGWVRKAS